MLEIAKIFGEPRDPRKPYTNIVEDICDTDTANPTDFYYYFDVLLETDKVIITNTANGIITQENITPDSPALITFVDVASPEFYIYLTELAAAKEKTIARKLKTINRALNEYEDYRIIKLLETAANTSGNQVSLGSGELTFTYEHLITMMDQIKDYGDEYTLIVSGRVDRDILLWDWTDNKFMSLKLALENLNVNIIRVGSPHKTQVDGVTAQVLPSNKAYLVANDTGAEQKACLFVRRVLSAMELIGGLVHDIGGGDRPERLIFGGSLPVNVGTNRTLAIGVTGYEQVAMAVTNHFAVSEFTRDADESGV